MSVRQRLSSERGFSLLELLVATAIMMVVTGAIFSMVNPSHGTAKAQPEVSDIQQRMRIGSDTLFRELMMAGAGPYFGARTGSLLNFFAPLVPRRMGLQNADGRAVYRSDTLTLTYIPNSYSQTSIALAMPPQSAELKVTYPPNCQVPKELCGFEIGMTVLIFDDTGHWDVFTLTQVQDDAAHVQHRGQGLNYTYGAGSTITQAVSNTYYRNAATNQLMVYDGYNTETAIVDNVVDLRFEYFGDPAPPTTPDPGIGGGANCIYDAMHNLVGLPTLTADEGSLTILKPEQLIDGPWCGGGDNEFDADLLRIRKVRVTLRMQASDASLRGKNPLAFLNPGRATQSMTMVPDYQVRFDITPRNLNLIR
jgi:prepilin-type N-terminal cleavage/methylation domain-containing protein